MSESNTQIQENSYICFNYLISLNLISDDKQNTKTSKYMIRIENSDDLLAFKICKKPLFEYSDLIGSLFYIRDIEECKSIYSNKEDNNKQNIEISCKELRFIKQDKLNQCTQFILQHLISGKFISSEMKFSNNKITLKLVNDFENASPFSFKKINEDRSSTELLSFNQIFYLNVFIKEEKQVYFVYEEEEIITGKIDNNKQYYDIILDKRPMAKFCLINQSWMVTHPNNIYSGQLINIIFSSNINGKNENFMLGVEEKKESFIEEEDEEKNNKNNNKTKKRKTNNYKVIPFLYTDELCEHVLKKTFWFIEEKTTKYAEELYREPIQIKEEFRIKHPDTGLYLNIKQKNINKFNNRNNFSLFEYEKYEYEFSLVDYNTLNDSLFFQNNFKFFHYIINDENTNIIDDGKYILKGICKNFNKDNVFKNNVKNEKFCFSKLDSYYLPISLSLNTKNIPLGLGSKKNSILNEFFSKNEFVIKNEDDFIFNIKKVNIFQGNEVIFIHKIIVKFENDLKNKKLNINSLNDWLSFLIEYLINLEYSYKDHNHETNVPIKERQKLLWKYNVIGIITNTLNYYLNIIEDIQNKTQMNKKLMKLLFNIMRFLLYLSRNDEDIKISIYIFVLNQIVQFTELLFSDDFSKLLYFIFELVNDSEILQTYLLGDSILLKKYIMNDPILSKMKININNLIKENKILDFIETNQNFLVLYKKLINLNKVQYKKEEIAKHISNHMEQVSFKEKNKIDPNKENYIRIMKESINNAKLLIKNNAIILDKFINQTIKETKSRRTRFRNSFMTRKIDQLSLFDKNTIKNTETNSNIKPIKEVDSNSNHNEFKKKKVTFLENKITDTENSNSRNLTTKSYHPLLTNEDNDILKDNMGSKESERLMLIDNKGQRKNIPRTSFRMSIRDTQKGILRSFSNLNSLKNVSKHSKHSKVEKTDKKKEEKKNNKEDYKNILNKLGKIWYFIKWYESFDFNYSIFVHDNFIKEIFKDKVKIEYIENKLFFFVYEKVKTFSFNKDLKINTDSKTGILYLFRIYNALFPKICSKLETKIKNNINITGKDIIEDMNENEELDPYYENINDEVVYKDILAEDKKKLDEYLCSFYSTYQFYINQYVKIVHRLLFILSNYFLNYKNFGDLKKIRECFIETLEILLSNFVFVDDNILEFLYSRIKKNPSLLNDAFNIGEIKTKTIQILSNIRKNSKTHEISTFFLQEKTLIDYLFLMCQQCDEIKYLYEKISIFIYIRNLLFSKDLGQFNSDENYNNEVKKQFKAIIELITTKKRLPILLLYEKYSNRNINDLTLEEKIKIGAIDNNNKSFDKSEAWNNYFYEIFKVGEITNFVTKVLKYYETEEFFNSIIYLGNKESIYLQDDKIIRKIRKIIDLFSDLENEILMLKVNSNLDEDEEKKMLELNQSNININKISTTKRIENIYRRIAQIRNENLECFDEDFHKIKSTNILYEILALENKTFYEKIHFLKTLKNMIDVLNYFKGKKDRNILGYISNLLRIFSKIKTLYPNFNKTIQENFELYSNLIVKSFECISQYPNVLIDFSTEVIFLNIVYYGMESFLFIITNCKNVFSDIEEFMKEVFEIMLNIIDQFKTKKNKLIYQILYFFTICRVLLYLNKYKTYDYSSYKFFYNKIFPLNEIKNHFLNNTNQSENKIGDLIESKNIILEDENSSMEMDDESNTVPNKENVDASFNFNFFPNEMHTYKLESPRNIINSKKYFANNNFPQQESKIGKSLNDSMEWYDSKEIERLTFYVSFLLVYSLYLNEKNAISKENEEDINDKNNSDELSLDSLFKKLKNFLSYKNNDNYLLNNNLNKTQDESFSFIGGSFSQNKDLEEKKELENEKTMFLKTNSNAGYLFIFSLFQAIVNFQHTSRHKSIEIPIKQRKDFEEEQPENSENEKPIETESDILLIKKNNNSIIFYYYESEYIDIILVEKIINEMSLKNNLKNYCLELDDEENYITPNLLKEFLKYQEYYKLISNYYNNEYNLVNCLFVKNNMAILIKKLFKSFNYNDFSSIEQMKYFIHKKMGEIYNHEEMKNEDILLEHKNCDLINYLKLFENKNNPDFNKINLLSFLNSLVYIYPKHEKSLCLLYYKIGFEILFTNCSTNYNQKLDEDEDLEKQIDLELIIKVIIFLFNRKLNRFLIEDKYVFNTMLLSMRELYNCIIKNGVFVLKHFELIKDFLNSLDFILGHLSKDFIKLVNFFKRPENLIDSQKYIKKKKKLEITLEFFISLLNFKKNFEEKVLTEEVYEFAKEIIERVIKLLFLLIEIDKDKSIEIMNLLLDFLFEFIKGPDIENINMLFSLGFFDLVSYVITNIDYYKLFLSYLKKDNLHDIIDNFSIIECKIIKIFIAYYNISYSPKSNMSEFKKLQHWYKNNFKYIRKKLKKLFYISEKEMENRNYDINKMLLFIKTDDQYSTDELKKRAGILITDDDNIENEDEEEVDNKKEKKANFCIIKFDLLLSYYTLFNYYKDLSDIEEKNALSHIKKKKKNIFYWIINFFIDFGLFLIQLVIVIVFFLYFFFKRFSVKIKKDVDLLQELTEIDEKSENYDERKIISFLKNYIKEIEVSINNVIYKIYFPMIDKSKTLLEYRKEYLKVDQIDYSDFTNYLLSNYDYINNRAKQNALINKWIDEFPILNYIFKNMYIYAVLLIILGLVSNFLIISSFSTFLDTIDVDCNQNSFKYAKKDKRVQCPFFFYDQEYQSKNVVVTLYILDFFELVLQGLTFVDYIIRLLAVESENVKLDYKICKLKHSRKKISLKWNNCTYLFFIVLPVIYRCFFNFQTLYYILSLFLLALGFSVHPFFNCIILLEFVNRIQLMQTILKAMYKPAKNILITLLMFIILEYLFSFFAVSFFPSHFPNKTDTKNFLKTFMRMMDQTFKQDGGIGTYLDKSIDIYYVPYTISSYFNLRFFFDLIFFLVILLLIFQMFLSIIIDYFNETRESNETFENNLETRCIVCGKKRKNIEAINTNDKNAFDKHITYYHNVFNYIYYLMYLQSSSSRDVIIDDSVWNLHLVKNLSYLPKKICFKQLEKKCWKKLNQINIEEEEEN